MYCQKCGKENADDAVFCISCGEKNNSFNNAEAAKTSNSFVVPPAKNAEVKKNKKKMKKSKKIFIIALVLFVFMIIVFAASDDESSEYNAPENTTVGTAHDTNLTDEEKIAVLKDSQDIGEIAEFFSVCPEDKKSEVLAIFEKSFLTYLTENRSELYSHDISFVCSISEILVKIASSFSENSEDLLLVSDKINDINLKASEYKKFSEANELIRSCKKIDGEITERIGDGANEGEYLNEYMLEYKGAYAEISELIIYSDESLSPGAFSGYLKYKDTKKYVSDGFDYTYDVYTIMSDREIEKYMKAEDITEELYDTAYDVDCSFDDLCGLVDNYAKKYPALITDENYISDYVGGYDTFPFEYLHKLSLKADNTFEMSINMYEGFVNYTGTFKKEGNLIVCENNEIYFELVISGESLIYHNTMEYSTVLLEDGTVFIR